MPGVTTQEKKSEGTGGGNPEKRLTPGETELVVK